MRTRRHALMALTIMSAACVPAPDPSGSTAPQTLAGAAASATRSPCVITAAGANAVPFASSDPMVAVVGPFQKQDAVAREIQRVTRLQQRRPDLDGRGVRVAVVDTGGVLAGHPQLADAAGASRVTSHAQDPSIPPDSHATHVAGSIASAGRPSAPGDGPSLDAFPQYKGVSAGEASKGMAPAVLIDSYSSSDCTYDAAVSSADVSNFSIVRATGWERIGNPAILFWTGPDNGDDPHFGRYDVIPAFIDSLVWNRPAHLVVAAAGNDRVAYQSPPEGATHRHDDDTVYPYNDTHPRDTRKRGFDTVHSWCVGKNVLCVGSIDDVLPGQERILSSAFSSWGPTDDGRVKPDVVANGFTVMSLDAKRLYAFGTGTSSAAPAVSGIAAIIQQEMRLKTIPISAALIKAVVVHSASDVPPAGPDPMLGYGLVNADAAIDLLSNAAHIGVVDVRGGATSERCFAAAAGAQPRVTAVWTDPPQTPRTGLDEPAAVLVRDIDVELVAPAPQGRVFHPWALTGTWGAGYTAVQTQANRVDNVEMIEIPAGAGPVPAGTWRVRLRGDALAPGTQQPVALIVSGTGKPAGC